MCECVEVVCVCGVGGCDTHSCSDGVDCEVDTESELEILAGRVSFQHRLWHIPVPKIEECCTFSTLKCNQKLALSNDVMARVNCKLRGVRKSCTYTYIHTCVQVYLQTVCLSGCGLSRSALSLSLERSHSLEVAPTR